MFYRRGKMMQIETLLISIKEAERFVEKAKLLKYQLERHIR
jgi:hypothetical protein